MLGAILVVSSNPVYRISLKAQLSAAFASVTQADTLAAARKSLASARPDLVLMVDNLADGACSDVRSLLSAHQDTASIPLMVLCPDDSTARQSEILTTGADDVSGYPVDGQLLMARLRNLLRARQNIGGHGISGFGATLLDATEPETDFNRPDRLVILAQTRLDHVELVRKINRGLVTSGPALRICTLQEIKNQRISPDVIVLDMKCGSGRDPLERLAKLKTCEFARSAAIVAICPTDRPQMAVKALHNGADDVAAKTATSQELAARIRAQLLAKRHTERLRAAMRHGLKAAMTDPLTGLYNRRYAQLHLSRIARDAQACDTTYAVMIADLDHFKAINDKHGHLAGDQVLVETAARLRRSVGDRGIVARIGGEEFLLIVPNVAPEEASEMAQSACAAIGAEPFDTGHSERNVRATISVGWVCGPPKDAMPDTVTPPERTMLARADRALYDAKSRGRNQVNQHSMAA